jgi:hypothetical protein
MYLEGREQADLLSKYFRKRVPGFENSYLISTGALLGVRESRRIMGEYEITASDLAHLRKFDDVVCISSHGYDIHNYEGSGNIKWAAMEIDGETQYVICTPAGFGATTPPPDGKPVVNVKGQDAETAEFELNGYYDIPFRCLIPIKLDNLLVAGRNLSSTVEAQSGTRLIMACFTMGEAAGTATAMSLKQNVSPRGIDRLELQATLVNNGVNLGQKMRDIPGLEVSADTGEFYPNPALLRANEEHARMSRREEYRSV